MSVATKGSKISILLATVAILTPTGASAQQAGPEAERQVIVVSGQRDEAPAVKGPKVKGIITARKGNRVQIMTENGSREIITLNDATKIKASKGFLGIQRNKLTVESLLNGLPVTIKTLQSDDGLIASQISVRGNDLKTANMIRNGTSQQFAEQTAATEALRGRMGDIDQYNVKGTANVYFDSGKAILSPQGEADLCAAANQAEGLKNSLLLVVGYTDSTGSQELNQRLSEKRAGRVVNFLQQECRWKPYRMLTPTGMAMSDPLASNDTEEGKAQNRRVSVNILVSKGLDGL